MKKDLIYIPTLNMSEADWLAYRSTGIGASEVGTLLGLDDYKSSLELFYEKIGDYYRPSIETISSFMGKRQEDFVADLWQYWDGSEQSVIDNYREGRIIRKCQRVNAYVRNPSYPWLFVSLDRKINKQPKIGEGTLEIKTIGGWESDKWESGLPPKYVTQVQTQILVCEFIHGEMAILEDGRRFNVIPFDFSENICTTIIVKTREFWESVVEARKYVNEKFEAARTFNQRKVDELQAKIDELAPEPDGSLAYANYLKERHSIAEFGMRRGTDQELEYARHHKQFSEEIKSMEEEKRRFENLIKSSMADHQEIDFGSSGKVYWTNTKNGGRIFRNKVA